jgi:hypothetical protein
MKKSRAGFISLKHRAIKMGTAMVKANPKIIFPK